MYDMIVIMGLNFQYFKNPIKSLLMAGKLLGTLLIDVNGGKL